MGPLLGMEQRTSFILQNFIKSSLLLFYQGYQGSSIERPFIVEGLFYMEGG